MANLNAVVTFLTAVGFLENLYAVVMFYAFWAWYMGHTSEYADFTFFDSFCFNRIHCNFHYWAWLSLVYGSYEQVASLYTVITFFDRLIWLCYTSSQKIYVCFWCFLTAFGYYRKWLFFKGIHCNFMIVLGIWVDHWTFIFHLQCNVWYGMAWYYIGTYWWRFLYLHYLLGKKSIENEGFNSGIARIT